MIDDSIALLAEPAAFDFMATTAMSSQAAILAEKAEPDVIRSLPPTYTSEDRPLGIEDLFVDTEITAFNFAAGMNGNYEEDGEEDEEGEEIIVTGDREDDDDDDWGDDDWGDDNEADPIEDDEEEGGDDDYEKNGEYECQQSATNEAINDINSAIANDGLSGTRQPEYGMTIADAGDGSFENSSIATGQSYRDSGQPSVGLSPPSGYDWSDVVASVHSHPPSGDYQTDRDNRTPSENDWDAADDMVARGANPDKLQLIIIDRWGTARSFNYESPSAGRSNIRPSDGQVVDPNAPPPPGSGCSS